MGVRVIRGIGIGKGFVFKEDLNVAEGFICNEVESYMRRGEFVRKCKSLGYCCVILQH